MGISRIFYAKSGSRLHLQRFMGFSGALCLVCYLLAALSVSPLLGLAGCVLCGFSVGILWPGTISLISPRIPRGGTALFAMLAMAGDFGGALGPGLVGLLAQGSAANLHHSILFGTLFPILLIVFLLLFSRECARQ